MEHRVSMVSMCDFIVCMGAHCACCIIFLNFKRISFDRTEFIQLEVNGDLDFSLVLHTTYILYTDYAERTAVDHTMYLHSTRINLYSLFFF